MKKITFLIPIFVIAIITFSCKKSSTDDTVPLRDYATQYAADKITIDAFLDTHSMTVDADFNVSFTPIPTGGLSIRQQYTLRDTAIMQNGILYKFNYIRFNEGDLVNGKRPTQVDSVFVSYRGIGMDTNITKFDEAVTPIWLDLQNVVPGWTNILPAFHTGTYTTNPLTYNNFGAGVMFLPSGMGYYSSSVSTLPSYSPLIFSFKLYNVHYKDQDGDGIASKDERKLAATYPDGTNNYLTRWTENPGANTQNYKLNLDTGNYDLIDSVTLLDTDSDGIPNMYDNDDDGDHYSTRSETKKLPGDITTSSPLGHYPFNPTATEPKGIPQRTGTVGNYIYDYTTPTRLRKHLDPTWNPGND